MAQNFVFPQNGDRDDAEHFASTFGQDNLSDYVEQGMGLTTDYTVPEVTVATGKAFVKISSGTAPSSGETVLNLNYVVQVPQQTVSLTDSAVNYLYLEPNIGTDDSASVNAYTTQQSDPFLLIGTIDTSADTTEENNREPNIQGSFGTLSSPLEFQISGTKHAELDNSGNLRIGGEITENSTL